MLSVFHENIRGNFIPQNPLFNPAQPFSDTFDTAYGFAPIQGIRGFLGLRWHLD